MEAIAYTGLVQQFRHVAAAAVLFFILLPVPVHAKPVLPVAGSALPRSLSAAPYALNSDMGKVSVLFTVRLAGRNEKGISVNLQRTGTRKYIAMNDTGKEGDPVAGDGVYSAKVVVDTTRLKPDSCFNYKAVVRGGRREVTTSSFALCVSTFPLKITPSDIAHPVEFADGSKAVADELVMTVRKGTKAAAIQRFASGIDAKVVGSIPALNFFQLRLSAAANSSKLLESVKKLREHPEVTAASINAIGQFASADTLYPQQSGLQQIRAQDVWGSGATGWDVAAASSVIVTVLDSGLDRTHPDFGTSPSNCRLAENDCGGTNDDATGHGTQVAGVIAAQADNGIGIAGIAYRSRIHSIPTNSTLTAIVGSSVVYTGMVAGFDAARTYTSGHGFAKVINASFNAVNAFADWTPVCQAIESAVWQSGAVAVAVNAAGNEGQNASGIYPARCVDLNAGLIHKSLFITVASNTSVVDPACGSVPIGQMCSTSNYGPWVDITAPGSTIWTTAAGGGYASPTGTSFAAPMVAGAAAILNGCGVTPGNIKSAFTTNTTGLPALDNILVPLPNSASPVAQKPRLDVYLALQRLNHAPSGVAPSSVSVNENSLNGTPIATLSATDADVCDKFTYSITGANPGGFVINASTGTLTVGGVALDYEGPPPSHAYNLTVHVADFFSATFDQPVTVNVLNLNDNPPVIISNGGGATAAVSIPENSSAVTTVAATDADNLVALTYSISGGADAAKFAIDSATGALTFIVPPDFEAPTDAGANNVYDVTVQVSDGTFTDTQVIAVNVTNVNDNPPVVTSNGGGATAAASVPENSTAVTTVTATDADNLGALVYSKAGGADAAKFAIDGTTGALTFIAPPDFEAPTDAGSNNVYDVVVQVSDGTFTDMQAIAVNVTNLNEAPSIVNQTFSHPEYNQVNPAASPPFDDYVGIVNASDPDIGDTLTFSITAGNDAVVNGVPQLNAFKFDPAIPGRLLVDNRLALNYEYQPVFNLTVQVRDAGNLSASSTVTVNLANDANDNGDPHINTVDGLHYDFQSAGEFVALRGSDGMEIQTRHTPVSTAGPLADNYSGLPVGVSVNTAVAARVGKHRVTYQMKNNTNSASSGLELRMDSMVVTPTADGFDLGSGGRVAAAPGGGIQIDFPDGTTMVATPNWWAWSNVWYLNIDVFHTTAREGIMGARAKGSWLPKLSDGSVLGAMPAAMHDRYVELYEKFADSWRVSNDTSLFDYAPDTSTRTFTFKEWPKENGPYVIGNGPVAKPLARNVATQLCRGVVGKNDNADCVFDVMVTGNRGIAKAHLLSLQIRTGLTSISVRDDRGISKDKERVTFTATVARHTAITRKESTGKGERGIPTGAVQFTLNGNKVGKPVKLDAKGQARLKVSRPKVERQRIGARYIPAKGSVFLASSSIEASRPLKEGK